MSHHQSQRSLSGFFLLLALVVLSLSCAEIGAPPGGEEDKLGPFLIGSTPANGALNVPISNLITIFFSEPLLEPANKSVFISPRPAVEPKIKFKGDRIEIELAEVFAPDRTYIVSLHSQITDRRRNKIDSLTALAFSTGNQIDSGSVAGVILSQGSKPLERKPASGSLVGLWDLGRLGDSLPIDSIYPDYLATTDKEGQFKFNFLPSKTFKLVAFTDVNRDERLDPQAEAIALPDRPIIVGGTQPLDHLMMRLTQPDSSGLGILSASHTSDHLVRLRLSKDIKVNQIGAETKPPYLQPVLDTNQQIKLETFREQNEEFASQFNLYFGKLAEAEYNLIIPIPGEPDPLRYAGLKVRAADDKSAPEIISRTPDESPVFAAEADISFLFSELIDTSRVTSQSFSIWNDEDEMIPLSRRWLNRFELELSAELAAGGNYRLTMAEFDLADLSGNLLGDSLIDYQINLLNDDSLGSISGKVIVDDSSLAEVPILVEFQKLDNQQIFSQTTEQGYFHTELPAGKYLIWGFIDSDRDGVITDGYWSPFKYSERFGVLADTIKVRARFETSGIEFRLD